jgi:hypothetical protein
MKPKNVMAVKPRRSQKASLTAGMSLMRLGLTALNNSMMMLRGLITGAKLRKKLVKAKRFWKINAVRPKIKAKLGRTRKYENEGSAKYGGLVKELGFLFVTQFTSLLSDELAQPWCAATPIAALGP